MDIRVLGPVEVVADGVSIPIGGPRQRLVLALLTIDANTIVSTDRLIDGVWEDEPPDAARRTIQAYVSNLRRILEPLRSGTLTARPPGYLLNVDPDMVDAARFEDLARRGGHVLGRDPAAAASMLREGLALWRGTPYADLSGAPVLRPEITRLEELRAAAVESRIAADLALGRHDHVIGELETLIADHPFNERFHAQLMTALYRAGRQADALQAYRRVRAILGEELGLEPGPELQELEQAILDHDARLILPDTAGDDHADSSEPDVVRGFEIRRSLGDGGWCDTFVAYQRSLQREVVLRIVRPPDATNPSFLRRLETVTRRIAPITHPNIVPLYDFWHDTNGAYVVHRYFREGSLADAMANGTWHAADTPRLIEQVGSALAAAHHHRVVHGNVNASDIMLDDAPNAYLTGFVERVAPGRTGDTATSGATAGDDIAGLATLARSLIGGAGPNRAVEAVLRRATDRSHPDRYRSVARFVDDFLDATGSDLARTETATANPYKGLSPFDEADVDDFFGRERLVSSITTRIAASEPRCIALVGAAGIGKSSILGAGLLPALRRGDVPDSASWAIVRMHPGSHPYGELATALRGMASEPAAPELARLTWGDVDITEAVDAAVPDPGIRVLLVIDQFEEMFTLVRSETVTSSFIDHLVDAVSDPDSRIRLAIALRADFYDRPLRYRRFSALLTECLFTVTPMTVGDLRRAVTEPAANVGAHLDPGLAGRIVDDVAGQPGALPLLQYAMTDLFEHRNGSRLTSQAYEDAGGVFGPLGRRPEAIYRDLTAEQQRACRQMFLRLVAISDRSPPTRHRVNCTELTSIARFGPVMRSVIDAFGDARLLTFDVDAITRSPTVEIAHEALIREWPRLRRWIDDRSHDVATHQRLAEITSDWVDSGHDPGFLLSGGLLARSTSWASSSDLVLSEEERALLTASVAAAAAGHAGEVDRIERSRALEARSRRRLWILFATWALVAAVAMLAVFSFSQWRRSQILAVHSRSVAVADHLATVATAVTVDDPQLGALLALRAAEITIETGAGVTPTIRDAIAVAVASLQGPEMEPAPAGASRDAAPTPLDELITTTRSLLSRGFTAKECSVYLGRSTCPVDTIASPLPAGTG